jgi:hypothetical protein
MRIFFAAISGPPFSVSRVIRPDCGERRKAEGVGHQDTKDTKDTKKSDDKSGRQEGRKEGERFSCLPDSSSLGVLGVLVANSRSICPLARDALRTHNGRVRIDLRDKKRQRLFRVEVDAKDRPTVVRPPDDAGREVYLDWDQAFDDEGYLRRCPACGCRELFVRKDFPQVTGFVIVLVAAAAAMALFGMEQVIAAVGVLAAVVLIDAVIFFFTGKCLVCYRCRTEFRDLPIRPRHPGWELAVGEKYRHETQSPQSPPTSGPGQST